MLRSMLAFEPDARPTAAAALAQLEELVSSHDRATADHTPGSSSAPGVNAAATPQISVLVRTVSGAAATVHVPGDATVGDLKARAAEVLEPVKLNSDHSFLLLHGGHKLGDHVSVSSLRKDDSTCFHLVALSTQSSTCWCHIPSQSWVGCNVAVLLILTRACSFQTLASPSLLSMRRSLCARVSARALKARICPCRLTASVCPPSSGGPPKST